MQNLIIISFVLLATTLWIWAAVDIIRKNFKKRNRNLAWYWVILFFPVLGPLLYFQLREKLFDVNPQEFKPNFRKS